MLELEEILFQVCLITFTAFTTTVCVCVRTAGGALVSSTCFNGSGVDQETDMKSMSKKEQDDEDELCSIVECTDRTGSLRKAIFPYLDFVARKGI